MKAIQLHKNTHVPTVTLDLATSGNAVLNINLNSVNSPSKTLVEDMMGASAELVADLLVTPALRDNFMYVPEQECWYARVGDVWVPDHADSAMLHTAIKELLIEAGKSIGKPWNPSLKERFQIITALKLNASRATSFRRGADVLNSDRSTVATIDGLFSFKSGEYESHSSVLMPATKALAVAPDFDTEPSLFLSTLSEIFSPDYYEDAATTRANFIDIMAYCLTGSIALEEFFILQGETAANGKSTLLNLLQELMSDGLTGQSNSGWAAVSSSETFVGSKEMAVRAATCIGRRVMIVTELPSKRLDAEFIKTIVADETVFARPLYAMEHSFANQTKVIIATNDQLSFESADQGIRRRLVVVPFKRSFKAHEQDRDLMSKLRAELPAITGYLLKRACRVYQRQSIDYSVDIQKATDLAILDSDPTAEFISDCFIESPGNAVSLDDINRMYVEWLKQSNPSVSPLQKKTLRKRLTAHSPDNWEQRGSRKWWLTDYRVEGPFETFGTATFKNEDI